MTRPKRGEAEYRTLTEALDRKKPSCLNDWRFTVDAEDLDEGDTAQMQNICRICPLQDICRDYATTARPKGGFWAGRYWSNKERKDDE